MTGLKQRVVVDGVQSSWIVVTSGVLQGSVLGPLLFRIRINYLDSNLGSKIAKFVDDTKVGTDAANPNAVTLMHEDLRKSWYWSREW